MMLMPLLLHHLRHHYLSLSFPPSIWLPQPDSGSLSPSSLSSSKYNKSIMMVLLQLFVCSVFHFAWNSPRKYSTTDVWVGDSRKDQRERVSTCNSREERIHERPTHIWIWRQKGGENRKEMMRMKMMEMRNLVLKSQWAFVCMIYYPERSKWPYTISIWFLILKTKWMVTLVLTSLSFWFLSNDGEECEKTKKTWDEGEEERERRRVDCLSSNRGCREKDEKEKRKDDEDDDDRMMM